MALALGLVLPGCSNVRVPPAPAAEGSVAGEARTLPLRVLPADSGAGRAMAVVLTGDGPVAGLADRLGKEVARAGVPAVVWSSPRYYWTPRAPEEAARDLDAVIRHFGARWGRGRVVLVGYSMGADVLPFLVNRLPPDTRARVDGVALLALAHDAVFEFRVEQWWTRSSAPARAVRPEIDRLRGIPVVCAWGRGDRTSACPSLRASGVAVVDLRGGHHFTGDHARLARVVVDLARRADGRPPLPPPAPPAGPRAR